MEKTVSKFCSRCNKDTKHLLSLGRYTNYVCMECNKLTMQDLDPTGSENPKLCPNFLKSNY